MTDQELASKLRDDFECLWTINSNLVKAQDKIECRKVAFFFFMQGVIEAAQYKETAKTELKQT